ncbi:MAG: hypothetical protein KKF41_09900 [Actinobacteria bacterium]|nr:hypothetical protein [Actinomycetota bacterium]MBU1943168.1 hypothetical protein [Actinomycetota bacterium]MBU2687886.1 hypothetical protein [Actinomycetota bacterium]
MKKTIVFAPTTMNLSEVTRTLAIAEACSGDFDPAFIGYGGRYSDLIRKAGFPIKELEPRLTPEKERHLLEVDRMEKRADFYTADEIRQRVGSEVKAFAELEPTAVVTGFNLSVPVSAQVAGVPLVWEISAAGARPFFEAGLATWPEPMDFAMLRWLPERWLNWAWNKFSLMKSNMLVGPINQVAKEHGLTPFKNFAYILEVDFLLFTDVPEMTGITDLPTNFRYIGPIITRLDIPVPEAVENIPRDKPIVYFGMGSSGNPETTRELIEGFTGRPFRVIAPVAERLEGMRVSVPDNVVLTGLVPAHIVNPMADVSVIHGGQGTVYTACLAGKPVVGIAFQPEQEGNLECLVRKGFAVRIRRKELSPDSVCSAVERLLSDDEARKKALRFKDVVESHEEGPRGAARFLRETFA